MEQNDCAAVIERVVASASAKGRPSSYHPRTRARSRQTWARRVAAGGGIRERLLRCARKVGVVDADIGLAAERITASWAPLLSAGHPGGPDEIPMCARCGRDRCRACPPAANYLEEALATPAVAMDHVPARGEAVQPYDGLTIEGSPSGT